jgi:hypothetical protein
MWREYTREVPARPFFAVIGSGLALAVVTGLAWVITDARTVPPVETVQSLPEWPIAFTLPQSLSWRRSTGRLHGETSPDGMRGSAAYVGKSSGQSDAALIVSFAVLPEGTTGEEAMLRLTGENPLNEEPIGMGPLTGTMFELRHGGGLTSMAAAACSDRGLAIAVEFVTLERDSHARLSFLEVCRSIRYKEWWIRHRKDEFFFPE